MWIETEAGDLVNVDEVTMFSIDEPYDEKFGWALVAIVHGNQVILVKGSEAAIRSQWRMFWSQMATRYGPIYCFPNIHGHSGEVVHKRGTSTP